MTYAEDRPLMTCAELSAGGPIAMNGPRALLNSSEFLKAVKAVSGRSIDRRCLQFYGSTRLRSISKSMVERDKICGGLAAGQGKLGSLLPHPPVLKRENSTRKTEETAHGNA